MISPNGEASFDFSDGETFFDKCVSYCLSYESTCNAVNIERYYNANTGKETDHKCSMCKSPMSGMREYEPFVNFDGSKRTSTLAIVQDYYKENCSVFSAPEDCVIEIEGLSGPVCDETNSYFGMVNYLNLDGKVLSAFDDKNVVREEGFTGNCARRCFGRAGCSAFFEDGDVCSYIIGRYSSSVESNSQVALSGALNGRCPSTSFRSSFTRRSQFFCLILTPDEANDLADDIVAANTGNVDTPLRQWKFEGRTANPLIRTSQYVSISMPDMEGNDTRYRLQ